MKVMTYDQITKEVVPDGSVIAIGGVHSHNVPMGAIRQLLRIGSKDLTIIGSISAGLPIDMLIGAGCVKRVLSPYVGMEMWGLAPNYRKAVESGEVDAPDICEAFPIYSLRAAANGLLFHPFPEKVHEYSDISSQSDLYKLVKDPFTGKEVYAVKALRPDIAIVHVQEATSVGASRHVGSVVTDRLMAEAAKYTIVTCDELVETIDRDQISIPSFMVDAVIPLYGAAFPTSSHGNYHYCENEIRKYLDACKAENEFKKYLQNLGDSEDEYLKNKMFVSDLSGKPVEGSYTTSELIACVFAREIQDGEVGICGAVSEIPMAAMRVAERLHAPNMRWISGGSGYVNPRGRLFPSSTDFEMSVGAEARLSMDEVIGIEMTKIDFFFAGGLQIDGKGNTNLAGIPTDNGWKLKGPGSVGLPFLLRAGRTYLYTLGHGKRTLVDKVAYVSGPGHYYPEGGPKLLVTNLCVFEWDDGWILKSLHPGVQLSDVEKNTGFTYQISPDLNTTIPPREDELKILREIDVLGVLR